MRTGTSSHAPLTLLISGVVVAIAAPALPISLPNIPPQTSKAPLLIGHPVLLAAQFFLAGLFAVASVGFTKLAKRSSDALMASLGAGTMPLAAFARINYYFPIDLHRLRLHGCYGLAEIHLKDDFDVLTATSADAAITVTTEARPDLVLLDLLLPGVSGFELIGLMRAKLGQRTPILMMTGAKHQETEAASLEAGADDYITKPFNAEVLRARIHRHIRRGRGRI